MANTYSQINIHCVFAVKGRENLLSDYFRDELFKYIYGILKNDNVFPLAVGGWTDHVHVFFELKPDLKISDLMRMVKASSSKWINEQGFLKRNFRWQEGYGAFSYSRSQRDNVIKYIMNQEKHHRKKTFRDEYLNLLRRFEIEYKDEFVFEFYNE
ncbi:MAG: IS200/IS605 family transposase [Bacteroidales bacterium]